MFSLFRFRSRFWSSKVMKMRSEIHQHPLNMPSGNWCENRCRTKRFLSENVSQMGAQMESFWSNLIDVTDPGRYLGHQSPPSRLPDLIFHDFGASRTDCSWCPVFFWCYFRIWFSYFFKYMFYNSFPKCRIRKQNWFGFPSPNDESGKERGGGVSPPGVFDISFYSC